MSWLHSLFSTRGFMPHGCCYRWDAAVIWIHVISDALIALAYYSIPLTLIFFVRRRKDLAFGWIYLCFAVFIVACGTTHVMEIVNVWHPVYWLAGGIKAVTALASLVTAYLLVRLIPSALAIPSPGQLHQANRQLRRQAHLLERTNRELEAFSYSVSHDLRAPLRNIHGFAEILQQESGAALPESSRAYLGRIISSSQRMSVLIDDLLAFSRMGAAELHRVPVDCDALAREVAAEIAEREGEGRNLEWRIASLPRVTADPALLRQVWINLLGNAVKYTGDRNPARVEVSCVEQDRFHEFCVRDNGVGFDMGHAGRLFQIFERLPEGIAFEGTGVGLANVRRIVERHGGQVRAEGVPGQGAAFYFTLPKQEEA
ncbi:MAG: ATP-binding protein [Verrucomicrobium sp.]|nr:ATP-binding protein [Verrucomicrobium sp.]